MNQIINSKNLKSHNMSLYRLGGSSISGFFITLSLLLFSGCGQDGGSDELLGEYALDVPIAYIKRPVDPVATTDNPGTANPRNAYQYRPGGNLYIREFASNTAKEYNLTASMTKPVYDGNGNLVREAGDVADPDVSYDGKKIVFAYRRGDPPDTDPVDQSKWDLWEYLFPVDQDGKITDISKGVFTPVFPQEGEAQKGNDLDPAYLTDGSIVFTSDRVAVKAAELTNAGLNIEDERLMDESNNEPVINLHIMVPGDSTTLKQIGFNQSHELDPTVISSGKIVYTRWEHGSRDENVSPFPLFQMSPDGDGLDVLYGAHSFSNIDTGVAAFLQTREAQDGSLIATQMSRFGTYLGGDIVQIRYKDFVDKNTRRPGTSGGGSAGQVSITHATAVGGYAASGRFTTPFPLWDDTGRGLVSWAPCEVLDGNGKRELCNLVDGNPKDTSKYTFAPPAFGIWMLEANLVTMNPIVLPKDGMSITDPLAVVDRISLGKYPNASYPGPELVPSTCEQDKSLCAPGNEFGLVKIGNIYDTDLVNQNLTSLNVVPLDASVNEKLVCQDGATCDSSSDRVDLGALQASTPDERPVRFVRVVRAGFILENLRGVNLQTRRSYREILGYHPVEPDGSVVMRVPANKPFAIELVDKWGRKFNEHSSSWLHVSAGGVVQCDGCHANHGQANPLKQSVQVIGASYVGADAAAPTREAGETMAETLDRVSCADAMSVDVDMDGNPDIGDAVDGIPGEGCLYRRISSDLILRDVWRNPDLVLDPNYTDYAVRYRDLNLELVQNASFISDTIHYAQFPILLAGTASSENVIAPENAPCTWNDSNSSNCRISINYASNFGTGDKVRHIQSLWEKSRWMMNPINPNVINNDPNAGQMGNYPCTRCHREFGRNEPLDNPQVIDIPDGQLNLERTGQHQIRSNNTNRIESYLELRQGDEILTILNEGQANASLQYVETETIIIDNTVDPPITQTINLNLRDDCSRFVDLTTKPGKCGLGGSIAPNDNNRRDGFFFRKMTTFDDTTDAVDHRGMLNSAEMKMIIEWIDMGGRYWGDPIDQMDNN